MATDQYTKLHLDFTDDGTLNVITQGTISLQKQVRALRQELSVAPIEQQQQIRLALAQAEIGLEKTKAQGKELFGQLSLIPGPMGIFAGYAQSSLIALRTLSQLSFKDIVTDFKIIGQSLFGVPKTIGEKLGGEGSILGNTLAAAAGGGIGGGVGSAIGNGLKGTAGAVASGVVQSIGGGADFNADYQRYLEAQQKINVVRQKSIEYEKAITGDLINVSSARVKAIQKEGSVYFENVVKAQKLNDVYAETLMANKELLPAARTLEAQFSDLGIVVEGGSLKIARNDEALRALTKTELAQIATGKQLIITEEGYVLATVEATAATKALNIAATTLEITLSAVAGVFAAIALIPIVAWLASVVRGTNEAAVANETLRVSIKENEEVLSLSLKSAKERQDQATALHKAQNKSDADLRKENLQDYKYNLAQIDQALKIAQDNENKANDNIKKPGRLFGISQEEADKSLKNYEDAQKQVLKIEAERNKLISDGNVKFYEDQEIKRKQGYQNQLRELESKIQLEIDKENTSSIELLKLYKQRNDMIDAENAKRGNAIQKDEILLREKQQKKLINDAIIDDKVKSLTKEKAIIDKALQEEGKDTDKYFVLKQQQVKKQSEIEITQAGKDVHSKSAVILESETKLSKELNDINIVRLNSQLKILKETQQGLTEYTQEYYQNELNIINKNEKVELADYEGNEKMKLIIKEKYNKQRLDLESKQLMDNANLLKRLGESETEGNLVTPKNVNKSIDAKYKLLQQSLNNEYQAEIRNKKKTNTELAAIDAEYNKKTKLLNQQKLAEKQVYEQKYVDLAKYTGDFIMALGEAEMAASQGKDKSKFDSAKKYAVAGIWLEKAAALGSIYMNTQKAMSQDMGKFGVFGIPLTAIDLAIGVAQAAGVIVAGATAASSINGTDFSPAASSNMGKNYASGGMINGADHSQGGVNINAQGGEAVMTRGAVTMFQPLLSMMNQMGGGTAFSGAVAGQAKWDNPKSPGSPTEPQIIKTYVVQSDLTSAQQRQARLKSLSTL